jgi:hypothetical protein
MNRIKNLKKIIKLNLKKRKRNKIKELNIKMEPKYRMIPTQLTRFKLIQKMRQVNLMDHNQDHNQEKMKKMMSL